jgi:hypothetical protein
LGEFQTHFADSWKVASSSSDSLFTALECPSSASPVVNESQTVDEAVGSVPCEACPELEAQAEASCPAGDFHGFCVADVCATCELGLWVNATKEAYEEFDDATDPASSPNPVPVKIAIFGASLPAFDGMYYIQDTLKNAYAWYKKSTGHVIYMDAAGESWYFDNERNPYDVSSAAASVAGGSITISDLDITLDGTYSYSGMVEGNQAFQSAVGNKLYKAAGSNRHWIIDGAWGKQSFSDETATFVVKDDALVWARTEGSARPTAALDTWTMSCNTGPNCASFDMTLQANWLELTTAPLSCSGSDSSSLAQRTACTSNSACATTGEFCFDATSAAYLSDFNTCEGTCHCEPMATMAWGKLSRGSGTSPASSLRTETPRMWDGFAVTTNANMKILTLTNVESIPALSQAGKAAMDSLEGHWDAFSSSNVQRSGSSGNEVSKWSDDSVGTDFSLFPADAKPLYSATALNGHPAVQFRGTESLVSSVVHPTSCASDKSFTWIAVLKHATQASADATIFSTMLSGAGGAVSGQSSWAMSTNGVSGTGGNDGWMRSSTAGPYCSVGKMCIYAHRYDAQSSKYFIDVHSEGEAIRVYETLLAPSSIPEPPAYASMSNANAPFTPFTGYIAEVAALTVYKPDTELSPILSCLSTKWATSGIFNQCFAKADHWYSDTDIDGNDGWQMALNINPGDGHLFDYGNSLWADAYSYGSEATKSTHDYKSAAAFAKSVGSILVATHVKGEVKGYKEYDFLTTPTTLSAEFGASNSVATTAMTSSRIIDGPYLTNDPLMQYDGALYFNYNGVRIAHRDDDGNFYGLGVSYGTDGGDASYDGKNVAALAQTCQCTDHSSACVPAASAYTQACEYSYAIFVRPILMPAAEQEEEEEDADADANARSNTGVGLSVEEEEALQGLSIGAAVGIAIAAISCCGCWCWLWLLLLLRRRAKKDEGAQKAPALDADAVTTTSPMQTNPMLQDGLTQVEGAQKAPALDADAVTTTAPMQTNPMMQDGLTQVKSDKLATTEEESGEVNNGTAVM